MKARNIARHLEAKVADWIESIEDEALRSAVRKDALVTGGAIASLLLGEEVNDYDIYFRTQETAAALARYYVGKFVPGKNAQGTHPITVLVEGDRVKCVVKSAGVAGESDTDKPYQYFEARPDSEGQAWLGEVMQDPAVIEDAYEEESGHAQQAKGKPKYRPVFITTNAITLSHGIQVVLRFHGEPDAIHENYDFVHCTNYWLARDGALTLRPAALEALLARELRYVGSRYPICSIIRLRKFIGRGWRVNAGQVLKMVMQAAALDLTDFKVLEDQLTGVDCAYFSQLLDRVKERSPDKVDGAYLVEIIDRMF